MDTLFPLQPVYPDGFRYIPDFLSEQEEAGLLQLINDAGPAPMNFQGYTARRKVAAYGMDWDFSSRTLSPGRPIPVAFEPIILRVAAAARIAHEDFSELLLTEYPAGSVINWHRDAPPFGLIAGLSLLSDCLFRFRPCQKETGGRRQVITIPTARRSLYFISGSARDQWEHSINPVAQPRYSITLRTLRQAYFPKSPGNR
jgi:alkylated DNA repair dioxygenase AlkB